MAKWEMRERLKSHFSQPLNSTNHFQFPIQLHQAQLITTWLGPGGWCRSRAQVTAAHLALADELSAQKISLVGCSGFIHEGQSRIPWGVHCPSHWNKPWASES